MAEAIPAYPTLAERIKMAASHLDREARLTKRREQSEIGSVRRIDLAPALLSGYMRHQ
jgi:hypothetical protein